MDYLGLADQLKKALISPTNWVNAPSGATNPITVFTTNGPRCYRLAQP